MSLVLIDIEDIAALFPAEFRVHWPGQTVLVCTRHKDGIQNLAKAMGMAPVTIDSYEIDGKECINCRNEACK